MNGTPFNSDDRKPSGPRGAFAFASRRLKTSALWTALSLTGLTCFAETTNVMAETTNVFASATTNSLTLSNSMPDVAGSMFRVFGALALVIALFLGGVWLFRNWQRLTIHRGQTPKLNVLESRSLGGRHALYVVGYESERLLVSASPTGVTLISHLPSADAAVEASKPSAPQQSFAQTLTQMLKGK